LVSTNTTLRAGRVLTPDQHASNSSPWTRPAPSQGQNTAAQRQLPNTRSHAPRHLSALPLIIRPLQPSCPLVTCTYPIRLDNPHRVSIQPEEKSRKRRNVDNPQPLGLPLLKSERRCVVESRQVRPILREVYQRRVGYRLCTCWVCFI
jgi:hypothetical protein